MMSEKVEKKCNWVLRLCSVVAVCSVIGTVLSISASQADLQTLTHQMMFRAPPPPPKTITFKRLRRDGLLQPITIELESMVVVERGEPGRSLQVAVPFNEPEAVEDDDQGLRFYRKTLPTPIYRRKDFQRNLLSYAPRDDQSTAATAGNNDFADTTRNSMVPTVLVGLFSAIVGCGVVLSALRIKRCVLVYDQDWSASNETSTRLSRLFRKHPVLMMSGKETTSSILDMSLYGTSKGESVSPISSAVMSSCSVEDDDVDDHDEEEKDPEQQGLGAQDILRHSELCEKKKYVFALRSTKTGSTASDSSPGSIESRDDVESTHGFLHDIVIVRPDNPMDLGILINDPVSSTDFPFVTFVHETSVLAGRIGEGDKIFAVNNTDTVGHSVQGILDLVERGLNDDFTFIKLTVMSAIANAQRKEDVGGFSSVYPTLSVEL